jgi:molybdopterin synthase sulfur carrier subunit
MELKVRYFGLIAEIAGSGEETLQCSEMTVSGLRRLLYAKYPALKSKDFRFAQNNEILLEESSLTSHEVAVLPPFSGG